MIPHARQQWVHNLSRQMGSLMAQPESLLNEVGPFGIQFLWDAFGRCDARSLVWSVEGPIRTSPANLKQRKREIAGGVGP